MFAAAAGRPAPAGTAAGHKISTRLGFRAERHTSVGKLSGGTRQKLNLALALLADPDILLLAPQKQ